MHEGKQYTRGRHWVQSTKDAEGYVGSMHQNKTSGKHAYQSGSRERKNTKGCPSS